MEPQEMQQQAQGDQGMVMQQQDQQQQSSQADQQYSEDVEQEQLQELRSDTSFVPAAPQQHAVQDMSAAPDPAAGQASVLQPTASPSNNPHGLPAAAAATMTVPITTTAEAAAKVGSPSKPTYTELQLRCQMLEAALEQQQQSSQAALTATLAGRRAGSAGVCCQFLHTMCMTAPSTQLSLCLQAGSVHE